MLPPSFFDCVLTQGNSPWNFVERYFYLEGISEKRGWQKFGVARVARGTSYLQPIAPGKVGAKEWMVTMVKIVSYATIIFPVLVWIAKHYYRSKNHFVIALPQAVIPQPQVATPGRAAPYPSILDRMQLPWRAKPPELVPAVPKGQDDRQMDTFIARNFASVRIDPNFVLKDAIRFFGGRPDQRLTSFPQTMLQEFLKRHGVERRIPIHPRTTIEELARKIVASKENGGVEGHKSYRAMVDVLNTLLRKYPQAESKERKLIETIRERVLQLDKDRYILDQMAMEVQRGNINEVNKLADGLTEQIIAQAKSPGFERVGPFMEGGWRRTTGGHRINVEVLNVNGKWLFVVAQAGDAIRNHGHAFRRDANNQPIDIDLKRVVPVKIFSVDSEVEAKELVRNLIIYKRGPDSRLPGNGKEGDGFYALFKNAKVLDGHNIPYRPAQTMGNCALRSQEEAFFYICQRMGMVQVANDFQDTLEDKIAHNAYPALREKIALRGSKQAIQPLITAPTSLRLSTSNTRHHLPLGAKPYVIGRMGDIPLPNDPHKYSREQARILMKEGKAYLELHERNSFTLTIVDTKGEKVIRKGERVELQKGMTLKFSDSYQMRVG